MRNIRILTLKFRNQLRPDEIKWFRGAFIHASNKDNVLFHNHTEKNYRYAYPLIQYKLIHRCVAILCVKEGVEAIGHFFSHYTDRGRIGEKKLSLEVDYLRPAVFSLEITERLTRYRLRRWIPLNRENYQVYRTFERGDQRIHLRKFCRK